MAINLINIVINFRIFIHIIFIIFQTGPCISPSHQCLVFLCVAKFFLSSLIVLVLSLENTNRNQSHQGGARSIVLIVWLLLLNPSLLRHRTIWNGVGIVWIQRWVLFRQTLSPSRRCVTSQRLDHNHLVPVLSALCWGVDKDAQPFEQSNPLLITLNSGSRRWLHRDYHSSWEYKYGQAVPIDQPVLSRPGVEPPQRICINIRPIQQEVTVCESLSGIMGIKASDHHAHLRWRKLVMLTIKKTSSPHSWWLILTFINASSNPSNYPY